ncbi:MAG: metallophosphoesterase family protein [Candidatus Jordarchaeaceae archaeon]
MRVAIFSDIHSNLYALEEVLKVIESENVDLKLCGGDLVGYGPFPNEVIHILRKQKIPTLMGNYDDGVGFDRDDCGCAYRTQRETELGEISLKWTKARVTDENKSFLRNLLGNTYYNWNGMRVLHVHGSPRRINEYLYENRPEKNLLRMLEPLKIDLLICGHTHIPYHRIVGKIHIVNTGSVGKPKDGDPRACYTLLEIEDGLNVHFKRVPYDIDATAQAIRRVGLPKEFAEDLYSATFTH